MTQAKNNSEFSAILSAKQLDGDNKELLKAIEETTADDVEKAISHNPGRYSIEKLAALISPAGHNYLEQMAQKAMRITRQRFGKTVQLYAPLYVSNYCVNDCPYCAFNRQSSAPRIRLTIDQAAADADILAGLGIRHILIVSGEDSGFVNLKYLTTLAKVLRSRFSSISVEIYPMSQDDYEKLFTVGVDGIAIYQETYNRHDYAKFHKEGPKADFDFRLSTLERAGQAGFRNLGVGFLTGLSDWRSQTIAMAEHAAFLMSKYWRARVSFSFPRLRPAENVDEGIFKYMITDSRLSQIMMALRLCFPDTEIVLSTREAAVFRDNMSRICVTRVSAGSRTNPGGYAEKESALKQFEIADERSPAQVAAALKTKGLETVWKDWDRAFCK